MMSAYWSLLVAGAYSDPLPATLYDPARQHAPQDRASLRVAALELQQRGLRPRDIAQALRISEAAVIDLLAETA